MPDPAAILDDLATIAERAFALAVAWHVVIALAIAALAAGVRPDVRVTAALLSLPLASVAALALWFGNPFNGGVFALASVALAVLASRGEAGGIRAGDRRSVALGVALIGFAWVYPHFLAERSPLDYLYGAPLGLIPCPTLALAVGVALAGGGLVGGAWRLLLAGLAAFYAVFGMLRLGVVLDAGLLLGALGLFGQHARDALARRSRARASRVTDSG